MVTTHFKLTEPDGITRRVSFPEKPTWQALAMRIQSLFGIPIEKVSVAYIDIDNDQVTLSSEDELKDYYATSHQPGQIIKFTVQDLSALRSRNDLNPNRNQFLAGDVELDDEWLGLGGVFVPRANSDGPHAFLESVASDADNSTVRGVPSRDIPDDQSTIMSSPAPSFRAPLDKGKGRADPAEDTSTASLLMEDAPTKPPVHVYEHSFSRDIDAESIPGSFKEPSLLDESTPQVKVQDIPMDQDHNDARAPTEDPSDPPLPSIDPAGAPNSPPSLSNDIATLVQAFSNVFSSHPELSEGLRNIARNAANGTYWAAHRESISEAAQRMSNEAHSASERVRHAAEQDAAKRVSEALDGFFRTFARQVDEVPNNDGTQASEPAAAPAPAPEGPPEAAGSAPPPLFRDFPFGNEPGHHRRHGSGGRGRAPRPWARWSAFPQHPPFGMGDFFEHPFGEFVPPPPPRPHHFPQFPPPPHPPHHSPHQPPPPPPPPHHPPHDFSPRLAPHIPGCWPEPAPIPVPPPPGPTPPPEAEPVPTDDAAEHELRSKVQEAKARYKAEKHKYRSELDHLRHQRRQHFERPHAGPSTEGNVENVPPAKPPVERVIAVQGRKGNPTMEVVSVQRHHTFPGHRHHRRPEPGPSDIMSRHVNRIARRLSDMGFTATAYPDLQNRIRAMMPTTGNFNPEEEDNIVTTLLEELLVLSPRANATT